MYIQRVAVFFLALLILAGCAPRVRLIDRPLGWSDRGIASWYGRQFHGRSTASGETFDMYGLTAAHRNLPFGTRVKVTNLENKKSVVVRINDRGPWIKGRIIDLSYAAAKKIGMIEKGVVKVRVELIQ